MNELKNGTQVRFPYGLHVLKEGGTVTIRGTKSNKFFNSVLNGTMEGLEDFKVKTPVKQISKEGMKTTEGNDIKGEVFEIILEKK